MWSSHLPEEEREDFEKYVANSNSLLERLTEIINKKIEAVDRVIIDPKEFDKASWAFKQADLNGFKRALKELKLFTDLQGD